MAEDASTELRAMLFSPGSYLHAWLLTLASQIPERLIPWATSIARLSGDQDLRGLLLAELAHKLPQAEQAALLEGVRIPPPELKARYAYPTGGRASFLMSTLAEEERAKIFQELFQTIEYLIRETENRIRMHNSSKQYTPLQPSGWPAREPTAGATEPEPESELGSVEGDSAAADSSYDASEYWGSHGKGGKGGGGGMPYDESDSWDKSADAGSGPDVFSPRNKRSKPVGGGPAREYSEKSKESADEGDGPSYGSASDWEAQKPARSESSYGSASPGPPTGGGGDEDWSPDPEYFREESAPESRATSAMSEPDSAARRMSNSSDELSTISAEDPPPDVVNLGFAPTFHADQLLLPNQTLACNSEYYLWLHVGYPMKESVGGGESLGVKKLPKEARLQVALFDFENELQITPGEDVGDLQIQPNGLVKVIRQPTPKDRKISLSAEADAETLDDLLFFPVRTPATEGAYRVRCNFYCEQILVQSHLMTAHVTRTPQVLEKAVNVVVDYTLSETLNPGHLASLASQPHLLSMMLNSGEDGSYNIRFFGANEAEGVGLVKDDAPIDADEIKGFLSWARSAMHKVAWDREEQWDAKNKWPYRYQKEQFDSAKLAKDLAYLARAGKRIYSGILDNLKLDREALEKLMSKSGLVQIALKLSPPAVLPAAIIYDYAWMPDAFDDFDNTPFTLCETFQAAIEAADKKLAPIEECLCFKGQCSLLAKIKAIQKDPDKTLRDLPPIICPSGFWGYRHALGFPLTLGHGFNANPVITYDDQLRVVAAVSMDPELVERDGHIARLKALTKSKGGLERDESYVQIIKRLKGTKPHVLYFYCHGGVRLNNLPYLEVGTADRFAPESFIDEGITWPSNPRPLVFINGCHTTSLNPEISLNFVTPLVQLGGASGVIGTEITIFEPLAVKFAEECLQRFLGAPPYAEGMPIGEAVRGARLELLRLGNPLGLVYIPFVMASLRMLSSANTN